MRGVRALCRLDRAMDRGGFRRVVVRVGASALRGVRAVPSVLRDGVGRGHRPRDPRLRQAHRPRRASLAAYERLSAKGVLRRDDAQRAAIRVLDRLHAKLTAGDEGSAPAAPAPPNPAARGAGSPTSLPRAKNPRPLRAGHGGVYIHGGPGCGKTFVMDLAYACLPGTPGVHKRREHFHSFMLATHHALHTLGKTGTTRDTVALYAADVAKDAAVLCLDEFQVTDVADAMIIRRLLDELWARGVVLVTTSNRAPDELYKNGLNRAQFVPCIDAIKARCELHEMASERDYRLTGHALASRVATRASSNASGNGSEPDAFETPIESSDGTVSGVTWRVAHEDDPSETAAAEEWLNRRLGALAKNDRMVRVARWRWAAVASSWSARGGAWLDWISTRCAARRSARAITPPSRPCFTPWDWRASRA